MSKILMRRMLRGLAVSTMETLFWTLRKLEWSSHGKYSEYGSLHFYKGNLFSKVESSRIALNKDKMSLSG